MPAYTCPHCREPFTAPAGTSAAQVLCPHCQRAVEVPATPASRWFLARDKKKYGPYTWQQLLTLAQRGELRPQDMILQEGAKQWVRADAMKALFPNRPTANVPTTVSAAPTASVGAPTATFTPPPSKPKSSRRHWLLASVVGVSFGAFLVLTVGAAYVFLRNPPKPEPKHVSQGNPEEEKTKRPPDTDGVTSKKDGDAPKKEIKTEEKKKKTVDPPSLTQAERFVEDLNRDRKAAGVGPVTLDAELSRGCQAHAKYLAQHVEPENAGSSNIYEEDPKKAGYSIEGNRAAGLAMMSIAEPSVALERWMGRLLSRVPLLSPDIQTIGLGAAKTERGVWYCVVDPLRGRGEPIIVYPPPKQNDVPIAFTGGREAPENSVAGFPISVTFPQSKRVTAAQIELHDGQGKKIDGFLWTPEKPVSPARDNTLALVPRAHLLGSTAYQVKASAQLDGNPWSLAWSFTTEDDVDSKGVWAKKALAKVNAYRAAVGLKPVVLDAKLSVGCLKHASYLVLNEGHAALQGLNAHQEDPKLPGYSEEGAKAGPASDIGIGDYEPIDAIDGWMATLYHRVPILAPNLQAIGFGCAKGRRQGWATVMNVQTGRDQTPAHAVYYPAPDQVDVPLNFPNSGEEPNPIPNDPDDRAGFPVTATLPRETPLQNATGKLTTEKGDEVPCWFSAPDQPANPKHAKAQGNVACLIAKDPLKPKTVYHVHIQGTLAGKAWEKKWQFTTAADRSVEDATREVLARVNHFRARVGLNAVTLDETQTRGCQLHAEFLAKNADLLKKRKASVNDEDPLLPWFTAEGRHAARQSQTFNNAPTPVLQIDDLMGSIMTRPSLLDPSLQRIGFGCAHDVGRGWRCVLDPNGGRGDARVLLYPAPNQLAVPLAGYDSIEEAKGNLGFPIGVTFPKNASVRKAEAVLSDAQDKNVAVYVSSPEKPIHATLQRTTIGVHPLAPLRPTQTYSVKVSAIVNGKEWRQNWMFTTSK